MIRKAFLTALLALTLTISQAIAAEINVSSGTDFYLM